MTLGQPYVSVVGQTIGGWLQQFTARMRYLGWNRTSATVSSDETRVEEN